MKKLNLLVLILLLAAGAQAQTISLSAGSSLDLIGNKPVETVIFPLKVDGVTNPSTLFKDGPPAYVKFNNTINGDYRAAFSCHYDPANTQLIITVTNTMVPLQGSYELHLNYDFSKDKGGSLSFTIVRPPAVLENLNKATTINETGCDIQAIPLAIRETGRKTSISDLSFSIYSVPGIKTGDLLKVVDNTKFLQAGKCRQLVYTLDRKVLDKLPLGPTPFSLYVNSNTLQQPLEIPIIVNRSLWKGYIVLTVFLGLLVGFVVKHVLKSKMDNEAAEIIAFQLIQSIKVFSKEIGDPQVKAKLAGYIDSAKAAVQNLNLLFNSDPAQTVTAIQAIQANFNQTRTDFQNNLNTYQFAANAANEVLNSTAILPGLVFYLGDSRAALLKALASVEDRNPSGAGTALTEAAASMLNGIGNYKTYWSELFTFLAATGGLPAETPGTLTWVGTETQILQSLPSSVTSPDFSTPMLSWNNTAKQLVEMPDQLKARILIDFSAVNPVAAKNAALGLALDAWIAMVGVMSDNEKMYTDPILYNKAELLVALNTAWTNAKSAPAPLVDDVELYQRDRGADELLEMVNGGGSNNKGDGSNGPGIPGFKFPGGGGNDDNTDDALNSAKRGYLWYSLVQIILLTLLIGLGAYKSYDTQFTGTFDQLATIFLVAFSMDVTISSVTQFNTKQTL